MTINQGTNFEVAVNTFALALDTTSGYNKLSGTIDLSYVYVGSGSLPSVVSLRYGIRTATEEIVAGTALPEIDTAFDFAATVPQTVVGIGEFALFAYLSCDYTDDAQVTSDTVTTSDVPVADPFELDYIYRLQKASELSWVEGDDNTRINDLREKWLKSEMLTKLAKALPEGKIFIGNAEGVAEPGDLPESGGIPGGSTGQVQINKAGVFAGDSTLTFDNVLKILATKFLKLAAETLLVTPQNGVLEFDGTNFWLTANDLVRRKIPFRLTNGKIFIGDASNNMTEIGTTDIYGATTATKLFLDTEANWYDGSGHPKASVSPGSGEVGQRHRNTNYIYECVALGEWVRYILPNGYVDVWGLPLSEKVKLENAANWTGKVYTGTALSGCLAGYKHFTNDYIYEFVALNTPIRYSRI